MRKLFILAALLSVISVVQAQVTESEKTVALSLVNQNRSEIGLSPNDLSNVIVSSTYLVPNTGIRMVYLQQGYKGIPVYNQLQSLAFRDGKLVSAAGSRVDFSMKLLSPESGVPSTGAELAVRAAFTEAGIVTTAPVVLQNIKDRKLDFGRFNETYENVIAELVWVPVENDKTVRLAWQVQVAPARSDDFWLIRVDATNNTVIGKDNLTVYDNWHKEDGPSHTINYVLARQEEQQNWQYFHPIVNGATYLVIKHPAESPQHPGGTAALHTDPWTWTPGLATTFKWHSDGTNDYTITRGNNVWATEDRAATNTNAGLPATSSTTPDPLTFNFPPDYMVDPTTAAFQQFAITNLFYWNNLMHDVTYMYGFNEAGGNFQVNNQGQGGFGNDDVMALAQSGAGTNNANFLTPSDGIRPRMRMYLFTAPTPDRDGDLDNGVIAHEYAHGISNRMTGGPSVVTCLQNAEQGGEGWSDYFGLMTTHNWATATVNDGTIPRPIGTYVLNQPVNGPGIRLFPYCTDMAVNPLTYASMGVPPVGSSVHNIGEIWCSALWEMTWEIIAQTNTINPDIFNPAAAGGLGGNSIAMKLVIEGMRLQPCSPGYIDARNAILRADTLFFGAQYSCSIWKAFTKRGMGKNASQGSSGSTTDQVPDFSAGPVILLSQNGTTAVPEGQNIVYNNTVTASICQGISNYTLRDTLPANVSFVSATNGGVYTPATRVVSWTVNLAAGATDNYGFTVNINPGSYYPPLDIINEPVASTTIDPFWTTSSTTANVWIAHNLRSHSAPNSFFTPNPGIISDQIIATTNSFALGATPPMLSFWHWYNTEFTYDGCVLEISTNGGGSWSDIGTANFVQNGYNGVINNMFGNPLGGRLGWNGNSNAFVQTKVNLSAYANQANVRLRWRLGSDNVISATGWNVDDILLQDIAVVNMRTSIFDNGGTRIAYSDTLTVILPPACTNPVVNAPTITQPGCPSPATGTIVVNATGTGTLEYSIDGGAGFQVSNTFSGLTPGNYNIVVRLQSTPACSTVYSSNPVVINAAPVAPVINAPAVTQPGCPSPATGTIVVNATGSGTLEYSIDGGAGFQVSNTFSGLAPGNYNIVVRLQSTPACSTVYSGNPVVINPAPVPPVINAPTITQPGCPSPATGTIVVNATGSGTLEYSINGGSSFQASNTFSGLAPGNYNIVVRLQSTAACSTVYSSNPVAINAAPAAPVVTPPTVTQPTCAVPTGTIVVNATGSGTLEYSINGGSSFQASNTFSGLAPGNYNIVVRLQSTPACSTVYSSNPVVLNTPVCGGCTLTCPANITVSNDPGQCGAIVNYPPPGTSGSCGTITSVPASGSFFPVGTTTVTVTSSAGPVCTFTITVNDTELPVITCPVSTTVSCASAVPAPNTGLVTATDNCPGVTVSHIGDVISGQTCTNRYTITRTYRATDANGNTADCAQTITVNDIIPPTLTCPANVTVSCAAAVPAPNTGSVTGVSDNCGGTVTVTHVGDVISGQTCANRYTITRTYRATDECGNFTECSQTITVNDVTPPALTCPANVTVSCAAAVPAPNTGSVTGVSDNCGGTVTVTHVGDVISGQSCANRYTITRTYRATDECGNFTECSQTITVNDVTPPALTCPANVTVSCAAAVPVPNTGSVTGVSDNCGGTVTVTHVGDVISGQTCANRYIITRTYRATDECGNFTECSQTITVNDITAPTLTCPANISVSCASAVPAPNTGSVTAVSDNCGGTVTVTHVGDVISGQTCANRFTITRTYRATDECGNFTECSQTITVNDVTPPSMTCPANVTVSCASAVPAPNTGSVTGVSDNCGGTVTVTHVGDVISGQTCANRYTITRTYRATDECGNFTECSQTITVNDVTPPTLTCPANVTVSCASAVPAPDVNAVTGVSDNCGGTVTVTHVGDVISGQTCANRYTITRTYRATDACGNFAECSQVITVNDITAPTLTCPANISVSCASAVPAPDVNAVSGVSDNCGGTVTVTHVGDVISGQTCANRFTITRTYRATDACGNFAECSQTITVNDVTGPVITCPANMTVTTPMGSCTAVVNYSPAATDNCGGTVTVTSVPASGTSFPIGTTTVNVTATDACGNSATCSFTVTVIDAQPPSITTQPSNRSACTGSDATFTVTAQHAVSYQWQVWNGTAWTDISGATSTSYTVNNVTLNMNTNSYRVRVAGLCSSVTSAHATLTVHPLPVIQLMPSLNPSLLPGQSLVITASVSPAGGQFTWMKNGVVIPGATGNSLAGLTVDDIGTYRLVYTDPNGCTAVSADLVVRGMASDRLWVYPNPNNGQFQVRFYNQDNEPASLRVYNSGGQVVYSRNLATGVTYSRTDVDLGRMPAGAYVVKVISGSGLELASRIIVIYK